MLASTNQATILVVEDERAVARGLIYGLREEGFTVEWEKKDGQYQIHEISCPYYQIGVAHPEVCTVDQTLISKMLALPANKVQCILDGGAFCTYVVQPAEAVAKRK